MSSFSHSFGLRGLMETGRRKTDQEEKTLDERISLLDKDVKNLRVEFDDHRKQSVLSDKELSNTIRQLDAKIDLHLANEALQHKQLNENILAITTGVQNNHKNITLLRDELQEPLEVYKTAKYGAKASIWVRNIVISIAGLLSAIGVVYLYVSKVTN